MRTQAEAPALIAATILSGSDEPLSMITRADSRKGAVLSDIDGTQRLYVGATIAELNWHVYAGIAKTEVYRPARAALHDDIVAGLIVVVGVALVALSGAFTVARR